MSTPIMTQAYRIIDGMNEGIVAGIIRTLQYEHKDINNASVVEKLHTILDDWDDDYINHWIEWFGLGPDSD